MSDPAGFGAVLRELRLARGLTQRQVAARCGVSCKTLGGWELGKGAPNRLADASRLASAIGATADERDRLLGAVVIHDRKRRYALYPTPRRERRAAGRAVADGALGDAVGGTVWSLWRAVEAANRRVARAEAMLREERQETRRLRDKLRAGELQRQRLAERIATGAAAPIPVAPATTAPGFDPPADFEIGDRPAPTPRPSLRERLAAKNVPAWRAAGDLDAGTGREGVAA